jgi:hypothetical protein
MKAFWLAAAMILFPVIVSAATITATYLEPSTAIGGVPLTSLSKTTLYWKQDGGAEQTVDVPASKGSGGGNITKTFTVADPPACGKSTIVVSVSATNVSGEGPRSNTVSVTKDLTGSAGCLKPKGPTGLTLTIE